MKVMEAFYDVVKKDLEFSLKQEDVLQKAVQVMVDCIASGGVIHVFGCGHSQMFGEELCFRTGGLVPINAITIPQYNIYPKVRYSQLMERTEGFVDGVLETMNSRRCDTMIVVSVSGRNPAGVEMAMAAKKRGMKVITLTSLDYCNHVTSRHSSGKLVKDIADIIIDMGGVKGDAALHHDKVAENFCAPSTVVDMSILVGLVGEVIVKLAEAGMEVPIWVSRNVDRGDQINQEYIKAYRGKVDVL